MEKIIKGKRKKLLKKIHVNQHNIRKNTKSLDGQKLPVITVKTSKGNFYGHLVSIDGESFITYSDRVLSCGAKVWIETYSKVKVIDHYEGNVIIE